MAATKTPTNAERDTLSPVSSDQRRSARVGASRATVVVKKVEGTTDAPFAIDAPGYTARAPIDWSQSDEVRLTR